MARVMIYSDRLAGSPPEVLAAVGACALSREPAGTIVDDARPQFAAVAEFLAGGLASVPGMGRPPAGVPPLPPAPPARPAPAGQPAASDEMRELLAAAADPRELGDHVAALVHGIGAAAVHAWYRRAVGAAGECRCNARRKWLNRVGRRLAAAAGFTAVDLPDPPP